MTKRLCIALTIVSLTGSFSLAASLSDDIPTLLYDAATGALSVEDGTNPSPSLRGMLLSASGDTPFLNALEIPAGAFSVSNDLSLDPTSLSFSTFPLAQNIFGTGFQFGSVLPEGLAQSNLDQDFDLFWQRVSLSGDTEQFRGDFLVMATRILGDCTENGQLDASDLACVQTIAERDSVLNALLTLPGDLDGNGEVSFADFLTFSANFGSESAAYTDGNIDLVDGIRFSDFLVLSRNFGKTVSGQVAVVPEPDGSCVIALCLLVAAFRMRSGTRSRFKERVASQSPANDG